MKIELKIKPIDKSEPTEQRVERLRNLEILKDMRNLVKEKAIERNKTNSNKTE